MRGVASPPAALASVDTIGATDRSGSNRRYCRFCQMPGAGPRPGWEARNALRVPRHFVVRGAAVAPCQRLRSGPHGAATLQDVEPRKADVSRARQPATSGHHRPTWYQTTPALRIKTHGFGLQDLGCKMVATGRFGALTEGSQATISLQISGGQQGSRTPDLRRANAPTNLLAGTAKCRRVPS